ncbi:MAG: hypothetical protein FGF47_01540 [Candidatus Brockarchaeota archaeon]|nr:hypothetical protein [Candidatus Brockarchaeota archaeon]
MELGEDGGMVGVEIKEETIYKKIRNSLISNNFKEKQEPTYGYNVFSDGKIKVVVKVVSFTDTSSYFRPKEYLLIDFMFEFFSLLIDESYDGIILVCPSSLGEQIELRVDSIKKFSKKLYIISYDRNPEVNIEVEVALSLFKDRVREWRTKKELKKQEVETKIKEKVEVAPKIYEKKKEDELKVAITELSLRIRNLEEKYDYIISRLEQLNYNVPKVVSVSQELSKVKEEEKVEVVSSSKQNKRDSGSLPSFFENNPWVEILSSRGKEK